MVFRHRTRRSGLNQPLTPTSRSAGRREGLSACRRGSRLSSGVRPQRASGMEDTDRPEVVRPADDVDSGLEQGSWWEGLTCYRVTDLWLFSSEDLTAMAAAFEARGLWVSGRGQWITDTKYWRLPEPQWHWSFQTSCGACEEGSDGPEPTIAAFLAAVKPPAPPPGRPWARCPLRALDVRYNAGIGPPPARHDLAPATP